MGGFFRPGKNYVQFPDRKSFRIALADLRDAAVRDRLRLIWTDPRALDPARHAAHVTRLIAERLAAVSKALERAGHVLVLKELHDRLDAAVAAAYGWPADPSDAEILTRLVALNRERAAEEANGTIRWLRPAYQIPRFGTDADKPRLALRGGRMHTQETVQAGPKPPFPVPDNAQTAAVMAVLAAASAPMSADAIAARFKQGRRVLPKIGAVLASLARFAFVSTSNGGRSFSLRLAS